MNDKSKVVVINGNAGAGKDEFVKCCEELIGKDYVFNYSTIDTVKFIATMLGWDGNKDEHGRQCLHDLKEYIVNHFNYPFCEIDDFFKFEPMGNYDIIFVHSREPEEIKKIVEKYNAITLLIRRDGITIPNNPADMNVEMYDYDYIINNNGTREDLKEKAWDFLEYILGKDKWDEL